MRSKEHSLEDENDSLVSKLEAYRIDMLKGLSSRSLLALIGQSCYQTKTNIPIGYLADTCCCEAVRQSTTESAETTGRPHTGSVTP
jgi:hypothetical protein